MTKIRDLNKVAEIIELKFHRFLKVFGEGSHIFPNLGYLAEIVGT